MVEIRLEEMTKIFRGGVVGVEDINLTIRHKEFMALLGPSGSGKSTTLYLIAGIYRPTKGRILFDDEDVTNVPPKDRNVGLVFQNWALYPHMRVYENIAFPLRLKKIPENEIRRRVREVAEMLRIEHLLDRFPWQLSGGQQQRVAIARALVKEPRVLLLDEPLSNLDAVLRISVRAELKRLQRRLGITTIYVTHDQAEALAMADRIALINEGRLVQVGTPDEVYTRPATVFVGGFLGNPPMNFIDAEIVMKGEEPVATVGTAELRIPERYRRIIKESKMKKVIIGMRPEDIEVREGPGTNCLPAKVYGIEPMGRESIVVAEIEKTLIKALAGKDLRFSLDQAVWLCIDPERIVLFDKRSKRSLDYLTQGRASV